MEFKDKKMFVVSFSELRMGTQADIFGHASKYFCVLVALRNIIDNFRK
jgi:hypothetical protein